jgi:regulator of nucleoside diphosphate kinase
LIDDAKRLAPRGNEYLESLAAELDRGIRVAPTEIPPDVVTMNSRVRLVDLDTNEEMVYTLVFPDDADIAQSKISVLAPIGTAMLGYRVGDTFEWQVPNGTRRLRVKFGEQGIGYTVSYSLPEETSRIWAGISFELMPQNKNLTQYKAIELTLDLELERTGCIISVRDDKRIYDTQYQIAQVNTEKYHKSRLKRDYIACEPHLIEESLYTPSYSLVHCRSDDSGFSELPPPSTIS